MLQLLLTWPAPSSAWIIDFLIVNFLTASALPVSAEIITWFFCFCCEELMPVFYDDNLSLLLGMSELNSKTGLFGVSMSWGFLNCFLSECC
jgi:hypothetical protein